MLEEACRPADLPLFPLVFYCKCELRSLDKKKSSQTLRMALRTMEAVRTTMGTFRTATQMLGIAMYLGPTGCLGSTGCHRPAKTRTQLHKKQSRNGLNGCLGLVEDLLGVFEVAENLPASLGVMEDLLGGRPRSSEWQNMCLTL